MMGSDVKWNGTHIYLLGVTYACEDEVNDKTWTWNEIVHTSACLWGWFKKK